MGMKKQAISYLKLPTKRKETGRILRFESLYPSLGKKEEKNKILKNIQGCRRI